MKAQTRFCFDARCNENMKKRTIFRIDVSGTCCAILGSNAAEWNCESNSRLRLLGCVGLAHDCNRWESFPTCCAYIASKISIRAESERTNERLRSVSVSNHKYLPWMAFAPLHREYLSSSCEGISEIPFISKLIERSRWARIVEKYRKSSETIMLRYFDRFIVIKHFIVP